MELKGKEILVIGAGKSGISACRLLRAKGAKVTLYDGKEDLDTRALLQKLGNDTEVHILCGTFPRELLRKPELVVISPGVPCDIPFLLELRKQGIPVWGEIELAYACGHGTILAVTGTNGKTTTTALLGEIMKRASTDVYVVGNIGNPYTDIVQQTTAQSVIVAELSSFQLETICHFHPKVSGILNLTPDHLNRHGTMEEYLRVKSEITRNQTKEEVCVLNYEDKALRRLGERLKVKVFWFSSQRELAEGIFLRGKDVVVREKQGEWSLCGTEELKLLGVHNYENVMAAAAMALLCGVEKETVRQAVLAFEGVPHRIEYVIEKNGVRYYNDSKATNPDAAIRGIAAMERPTFLIGGGYDKGADYREWISSFAGKVKKLVLVGETKEKIATTAEEMGFFAYRIVATFEEAVQFCKEEAKAGEAVLLSPACASWGMFENYEKRGEKFKELVKQN